MKCLLVVAHGSRRSRSNDEIRELAVKLANQSGNTYGRIVAAFLEIAEPSIPEGLEKCISEGATEIVVFPYFLSAGRHVIEDIPSEAEKVAVRFPNVRITIADYLGSFTDIPKLIARHFTATRD